MIAKVPEAASRTSGRPAHPAGPRSGNSRTGAWDRVKDRLVSIADAADLVLSWARLAPASPIAGEAGRTRSTELAALATGVARGEGML